MIKTFKKFDVPLAFAQSPKHAGSEKTALQLNVFFAE